MLGWVLRVLPLLVVLAACPAPRPKPPKPLPPGGTHEMSFVRVTSLAEVPRDPPAPGTYRIHLIDVGTGLSVLVHGSDFALLYDAGTNDRQEKQSRVVEYLRAALGPSGTRCAVAPTGSPKRRSITSCSRTRTSITAPRSTSSCTATRSSSSGTRVR